MPKCLLNNTPLLVRLNAHYVFVKLNARLSFFTPCIYFFKWQGGNFLHFFLSPS